MKFNNYIMLFAWGEQTFLEFPCNNIDETLIQISTKTNKPNVNNIKKKLKYTIVVQFIL